MLYDSRGFQVREMDEFSYEVPKQKKMRVPGIIYSSPRLIKNVLKDGCVAQVANVAHLPGIVGCSLAMPDIHQGYGFPIGGVAAFDAEEGVVSPGGVGYDINCGVRIFTTNLKRNVLLRRERRIADALYDAIPCGVGSKRKDMASFPNLMEACLTQGAQAAIEAGFGGPGDLERIEAAGKILGADSNKVSLKAKQRGEPQLGTLGSGNHFVEISVVDQVLDEVIAEAFGLQEGKVTVALHTGSRGFGHQVCGDYLKVLAQSETMRKYEIPDRQLCCARIDSSHGKNYLAAMAAAANYAFANRQIIGHFLKQALAKALGKSKEEVEFSLLYDLAHNIAKFETHKVDGKERRVLVHRKGATRAFPPGHADLKDPLFFKHGQPVFLPGDMGRYSYILVGTEEGSRKTFGSSAHGAGRRLSRSQAKRQAEYQAVVNSLKSKGIHVRAASRGSLVEEMPEAYKDVAEVMDVVRGANIGKPVARVRPLIVVKG